MVKKPTEILEGEHHVIHLMVGVMAIVLEGLSRGQKQEPAILLDLVDFMRIFADQCHHGKEETHLFPLLESKGVPVNGCPLGILIHEHNSGRKLVAELAAAAAVYEKESPESHESLRVALQGLVNLYPNHIWKEDYLLFPMTNKILADEEQQELYEKFVLVDAAIGKDVHNRFTSMAERLAAQMHRL